MSQDTPEEIRAAVAEEELREVIRSLREYLMKMNTSRFSVDELRKLILPNCVEEYSQGYKEWLLRLKKGADKRILGGRH